LRRFDWVLQKGADVLGLGLGANDGLRGLPVGSAKANLEQIISKFRSRFPSGKILLLGMQLPPNFGAERAEEFKSMYRELATEQKLPIVPFLLEGVGGNPSLNLPDGIHPSAEGQTIVAKNVWKHLQPLLCHAPGKSVRTSASG
jgi:acyl-CoA thioesterase-1